MNHDEFKDFNYLNDKGNQNGPDEFIDIYNNHFYGYQSSKECSNDIKVLFSL